MASSDPSDPVIVIGAGIVGTSAAAFLTQAGLPVRLIEAKAPASGATGAADGAVSVASKRPGVMMGFARQGMDFYRHMTESGVFSGIFQERPTLLVASSAPEAEVLERHAAALRNEGVQLDWLDRAAVQEQLPALAKSTMAVLKVQGEGHATGFRVVDRLITTANLRVERNSHVQQILRDPASGRANGVLIAGQRHAASAVIVAAGAGAADLLGLPGMAIARRGQQLVTERAPHLTAMLPGSIISASYLLSKGAQAGTIDPRGYGIVIDPQDSGQFLIGSTREEGQTSPDTDLAAIAHMAQAAAGIFPALADLRVIRCFAGIRTAITDGLPVIGAMPGAENLFVATGFEGDGICLGPLTGHIVAGLVQGLPSQVDLFPFDPARFSHLRAAA